MTLSCHFVQSLLDSPGFFYLPPLLSHFFLSFLGNFLSWPLENRLPGTHTFSICIDSICIHSIYNTASNQYLLNQNMMSKYLHTMRQTLKPDAFCPQGRRQKKWGKCVCLRIDVQVFCAFCKCENAWVDLSEQTQIHTFEVRIHTVVSPHLINSGVPIRCTVILFLLNKKYVYIGLGSTVH